MSHPSWKPLRLSFDLDQRVEELFRELIHKPWGFDIRTDSWQPAIDLCETDSGYVLEADLPGARLEDIDLNVEGRALTISGRRESVNVNQTALQVSVERVHGQFSRRFELTHPVDADRIEIHFENGIYRACLPKMPASDRGKKE